MHDMIVEGLYLGGWPFLSKHLPPGSPSVIDCTCDLPRSSFIPADEYLCLATWDTRAPTPCQIELAHVGLVKRDLRGNRFMSTVHLVSSNLSLAIHSTYAEN